MAKRTPVKVDTGWPKTVMLLDGTVETMYSEAQWRASVKKRKKRGTHLCSHDQ